MFGGEAVVGLRVLLLDPAFEVKLEATDQAVAADTQQLAPIDPWYRSGGGRRAVGLTVSAVAGR